MFVFDFKEEEFLVEESYDEVLNECRDKYSSDSVTLISILESLSPIVTSTKVGVRKSGLRFITDFLFSVSFSNFPKEIKLFCQFYADRCKDHHSMYPDIIRGCALLLNQPNTEINVIVSTLRVMNSEISFSSQTTNDRYKMIVLLTDLLNKRSDELASTLGSEFVSIWLGVVNEEKDPKNLNLVLTFWPKIIENFSIENYADDVFFSLSVYFPIDFTPPKGSPYTKEGLTSKLCICLTQSDKLTQYVLPFLIEKIDSDYTPAKVDGFSALSLCLKTSNESLQEFIPDLWRILKENLLGTNEDYVNPALETVSVLSSKLLPDSESFKTFAMDNVWKDVKGVIGFMTVSLSDAAIRILRSIIISAEASERILPVVIPEIMEKFRNARTPESKSTVLRMAGELMGFLPEDFSDIEFVSGTMTLLNAESLKVRRSAIKALSGGGLSLIESKFIYLVTGTLKSLIESGTRIEEKRLLKDLASLFPKELIEAISRDFIPLLGTDCPVNSFLEDLSLESSSEVFGTIIPIFIERIDEENSLKSLLKIKTNKNDKELWKNYDLMNVVVNSKCDSAVKYDLISLLSSDLPSSSLGQLSNAHSPKILEAQWRGRLFKEFSDLPIYNSVLSTNSPESLLRLKFNFLNKTPLDSKILCELNIENQTNNSLIWTTRALVLSGYKNIHPWLKKILIQREYLSEAFDILSRNPEDDVPLHKNLNVSSVYRQKVFVFSKSSLISTYKEFGCSQALSALMIQASRLPFTVLKSHMTDLKTLLVEGLSKENTDILVMTSILKSCLCLLEASLLDESEIEDFLPYWLRVGIGNESMEIRLVALECVEKAPIKIKDQSLLTRLAGDIVRKLNVTLDDRKRLVRKIAVSAKNRWCLAV